jgi:hypothetical protein
LAAPIPCNQSQTSKNIRRRHCVSAVGSVIEEIKNSGLLEKDVKG